LDQRVDGRSDGEGLFTVPGGWKRGNERSFWDQVKWKGVMRKSFNSLQRRRRGDEVSDVDRKEGSFIVQG
jgi:hypothetical protein